MFLPTTNDQRRIPESRRPTARLRDPAGTNRLLPHDERRKFSKSCCCDAVKALYFRMTRFAYDPELLCDWIA